MDQEAEKEARRMEGQEVRERGRKRRREEQYSFPEEVAHLEEVVGLASSLATLATTFPGLPGVEEVRDNNRGVRAQVKALFARLESCAMPEEGRNPGDKVVKEGSLLLPPLSSFLRCDVADLAAKVVEPVDLVVMDPPWENRHVKRVRACSGYSTLPDSRLADLPLAGLVRPGGLLLAWCTNSPSHRLALRECFRRWGLGLEATCYWLKVTRYGELVTPYSGGKQPYEVVLVGRRAGE